ncbi:60S ribosomal protein L9 [Clydaea vesicula]|uniref:60S ribosomal protein L9 n=1 Tax=Clydaea vesicula TaxID=447962 RepID=A0AAD5U7S7_9FUNG|nr:60S ribosomal protein L9 [Clydaea vesicula]KAJ3396207.1 60S ribosomal protein L9 [Lobulomyces angularis]
MRGINQKSTVTIPEGVTVDIKARKVRVKGPRGVLLKDFKHVNIELTKTSPTEITVIVYHGVRKHVACIRTVCSHITNMINGVTKGFEYKMRFVYAHFPINCNINDAGNQVEIRNFLGEKIIRRVKMLEGVSVANSTSGTKDEIVITGNDIQNVSQSAALINQTCHVKNKDIRKFLDGIYVSEKGFLVKDD